MIWCGEEISRERTKPGTGLRPTAPGGNYVLGSGNSVTNYCKAENVLAMYDEGRKLGIYPIQT